MKKELIELSLLKIHLEMASSCSLIVSFTFSEESIESLFIIGIYLNSLFFVICFSSSVVINKMFETFAKFSSVCVYSSGFT